MDNAIWDEAEEIGDPWCHDGLRYTLYFVRSGALGAESESMLILHGIDSDGVRRVEAVLRSGDTECEEFERALVESTSVKLEHTYSGIAFARADGAYAEYIDHDEAVWEMARYVAGDTSDDDYDWCGGE